MFFVRGTYYVDLQTDVNPVQSGFVEDEFGLEHAGFGVLFSALVNMCSMDTHTHPPGTRRTGSFG